MNPENKRKNATKLISAIKKNDLEKIKHLSQYGVHTESVTDSDVFDCAIKEGSLEVIEVLFEKGYFKGEPSEGVLHRALKRKDENILDFFLSKGLHKNLINKNIHNNDRLNLMEYAFFENKFELIKKLMDYGFSVKNVRMTTIEELITFNEFKSFSYIIENYTEFKDTDKSRLLYKAIQNSKVSFAEFLLNQYEELRSEVQTVELFEKRNFLTMSEEMERFINAFNSKIAIENILEKQPETNKVKKVKI